MIKMAALVFALAAAALVAFHFAILLGAPWGHLTMGGRWQGALPMPARLLSLLSMLLLGGMAYAVLSAAQMTRWTPPRWLKLGILGYMIVAIAVHIATPSAPERTLWLPVILVMMAALLIVQFKRPPNPGAGS